MVADPKAEALVTNFAGQWLFIRAIDEALPDVWFFPDWTDALRDDMRTEAEHFFRNLILEQDRDMTEILTGETAYINERLATHYGIPNVSGDEFREVSLASTERTGYITSGALMTSTAFGTRTSPVKRGEWVMSHLLCREPPPPPAGVEGIPVENPEGLPLRERLAAHRADPICQSCHVEMDEIGFAFENFDGIGAWRTVDEGWAIDAAGELPSGATFDGAQDLAEVLADDVAFAECTVENAFTYALGRGPTEGDQAYRDEVTETFDANGRRFSELLTQIVVSEPFRLRRGTLEE